MICKKCKKEIVEGSEFCSYCGCKINNEDTVTNRKNTKGKQNSKRKFYCLILAIIIVILIILASIYILISNKKDINNDNSSQNEYIQQNSITQENVENTTEIVELGNIKLITTTDNSTKKNSLIEYLQDEEWVQDNLILKKNVFGDAIVSDDQQAIKYNIINDKMIITYTRYQGSGDGMRCSILTFNDGKVNITRFEEGTNRYTDYVINKEKNILYTYYTFMGYTLYQIFGINEDSIGIIGYLEMDDYIEPESGNRILKYRFNEEEINKLKYEELKNQYIVENNNAENKFVTLFEGTNYIEE